MKLSFKKLSYKMKVKLGMLVVFAFIIALVIHEDHAGVVLRKFKPKRNLKVTNSSISKEPVSKAKVVWKETNMRSMSEGFTDDETVSKGNEMLLNSSVTFLTNNETIVEGNKKLLNSSVVYHTNNEIIAEGNEVLLNSSVICHTKNESDVKTNNAALNSPDLLSNETVLRTGSSKNLSKDFSGHNCSKQLGGQNCSQLSETSNISSEDSTLQEAKQHSKANDGIDESDSVANKNVQQQNEQVFLEFGVTSDDPGEVLASNPSGSKLTNITTEKLQESNLSINSKNKEADQANDIVAEDELNKSNVHFNREKIVDESLETLAASSTAAPDFEKSNETQENLETLSKVNLTANLKRVEINKTHLDQTSSSKSPFEKSDEAEDPSKKDLTAISNKTNGTLLNKTSSTNSSLEKPANETEELSKDLTTVGASVANEVPLNQASTAISSPKASANETKEILREDLTVSDTTNETLSNQTGLESIVSAGLEFLTNSEVAKNAMEIFNISDTSLTDHIIEDGEGVIELVSSNEIKDATIDQVNESDVEHENGETKPIAKKKCPPPGICVFWFMAQNICNNDNDCGGLKICCRIRCSKQCLDV